MLLALGLDVWIGEPPQAWHPVAWTGRVLTAVKKQLHQNTRFRCTLAWLLAAAAVLRPVLALTWRAAGFPRPWRVAPDVVVFKPIGPLEEVQAMETKRDNPNSEAQHGWGMAVPGLGHPGGQG